MSERLAVSAAFSVLLMAIYVLFGAEAQRVPFGPEAIRTELASPAFPDEAVSPIKLFGALR
ncbi:hypothetical protein B2G71_14150 [Novosphingobium sp. PC22D]|uniref:hypothetical protein n=1 Tax=Novosphingobium sp. PC22D TaxID=1962403 RepID=UPI000BF1CBB5|nr:hypothetical protein [Novosphingobium sp. PC22D]PEQ11923.1 hypothetical protein B2G71_14150 [Novosphingobium sp. PC22D]